MAQRISAIVSGRVQGVGFRFYTRETASSLRLVGYVRNVPDGTVELEAEGTDAAIAEFETWLNTGPPGASVNSVTAEHIEPTGGSTFEIRR